MNKTMIIKLEIIEELLKQGLIKNPKQYFDILNLDFKELQTEYNRLMNQIQTDIKNMAVPNVIINSQNPIQPRTGYQPNQGSTLFTFIGAKTLDQINAKKLLELEYRDNPISESELNNVYKAVFNLSQDEIDALIKEIETEQVNKQNVNQLQYIPSNGPYYFIDETTWKTPEIKTPIVNGNTCKCEMVLYQGLSESFNHCKKCGQKE